MLLSHSERARAVSGSAVSGASHTALCLLGLGHQVSFPFRSGRWIPKAELFVFPADVEVQDFAVPPVMGLVRMDDGDRLVHPVHQAVSGQACLMVLAAGGSNLQYSGMPKAA